MRWTAVVPLKASGTRKTRLAGHLSDERRRKLSQSMFDHVTKILQEHPSIQDTFVLSSEIPPGWKGDWIADLDRGLNGELQAARNGLADRNFLAIHADLPLLCAEDVTALLAAAETTGAAIAPDRHGKGTNALALTQGRVVEFCFGNDSFARHLKQIPDCAIVVREGLGLDLDTPDDLNRVILAGRA
ncbi:2-phospho-L-lactate guanylyltransferase [Rhizorhapis sp. SPR117]|uniref:2-phospho-L-lactate guanylyltransferase n=1 Tax=Rhizorhapis sp. SPR117 TaxID=2912611 RepID=UPI001F00585A|nr:2-phospho-L-lactate guanylyltransferase [Rhizorhapis sp. SPR117]